MTFDPARLVLLPKFLSRLRAEPSLSAAPLVDYLLENDATLPDVLRLYAGPWPHDDPVWQEPLAAWCEAAGDKERAGRVRAERVETIEEVYDRLDASRAIPNGGWFSWLPRAERDRKRRTLALFPEVRMSSGRVAALALIGPERGQPVSDSPPLALLIHASGLGYPVPEAVRWVRRDFTEVAARALSRIIYPCACALRSLWDAVPEDEGYEQIVCEPHAYRNASGHRTTFWLGRCPGKCGTVVWGMNESRSEARATPAEPRGILHARERSATLAGLPVNRPESATRMTPAALRGQEMTTGLRRRLPRRKRP